MIRGEDLYVGAQGASRVLNINLIKNTKMFYNIISHSIMLYLYSNDLC